MSTVPRRPRPQPGDRAQTILTQTRGAHSGQGSSAAARPVTATRLNRQQNPPVTGGLVASASYRDPATGIALGAIGNPSGLVASSAAAGSYFSYNGTDGIILLRPGWYQVSSSAVVSGATAGDALRAFCYFTTPQTVEGTDIADLAGVARPVAMSLPFYDDGTGTVVQVAVENHSGSSGTVGHPTIHLVAFG